MAAIVLQVGNERSELMPLAHVPLLADSADTTRMDSVLAAVAAAWALRVTQELIRAGLATFEMAPANSKEIV